MHSLIQFYQEILKPVPIWIFIAFGIFILIIGIIAKTENKIVKKYIDLKPNIIKLVGSILFAPLTSIISLIIYGSLRCLGVGCLLGVPIPLPECTHNKIFSCCSYCIRNSTQQFKTLLLILALSIVFFVLIYVIYSLIPKKKMKFAIFCTLLVLILALSLTLAIGGLTIEFCLFIGAIIIGASIFYWIWKKCGKK